MAANNPLLFNAAVAGYLAGMFAGQNPADATATDYNNAVLQASSFATALDTAIVADVLITAAGAAIVPTTSVITENESARPMIIYGLSYSAAFQHYAGPLGGTFTPTSFTTGPGATLVAAVKAIYTQALTVLQTP
jgi:hypothetical protein